MSREKTKKTITNCAKSALFFEIVAFICLISAAVVALLNTRYYYRTYDYYYNYYYYDWYYDYYAYDGGILEIVATILCFVSIILSSIIASGKINKVKGIAVGNVVIVTLLFIFSAAGMGVLLCSETDAFLAGLIPGTMAFCLVFIALILVAVVLGLAKEKPEPNVQISNPQQQAGARPNYTYSNYATVQTRMSADSAAKALRDYKILHESGLLTDREFAEQKAKILKQLEI